MACKFFQTLEAAKDKIGEYCTEQEQDIFIVKSEFPSGEEYSYRTRQEITFIDSERIVFAFHIPLNWQFKVKENAEVHAQRMADKTGRLFFVQDHYVYRNGYKHITHYTITDKYKSCST